MNIDDSDAPRSCSVKSKYFSAGSAMDESLSDFKEPKKSCAGPKKTVNNPKTSKPRKATKRPKGQKDIRTALKSTKKDLESYAKDFDKVCKKAAIDVDSEELQLAIALSKSLQDTPSSSTHSGESSQTSSTQGRIGKIRTTLQEYGFKVPGIKIAGNTRKAPRKHRTNYKLIQTSDTEKKEIIAEKYSHILFQDISHCNLYYSEVNTSNIPIYYLASNVSYDILKVTDTFYINNFIEKSASNGNLLRDWSTIPGRPESPKLFEPMSMNFSEIEFSQDELDIVLSGTINRCRNIVSKKIENWPDCNECKIDNISKTLEINREENLAINSDKTLMETMKKVNRQENDVTLTKGKKYRSCSPDMFDEDSSDLFDDSKSEMDTINIKSTETYGNKSTSNIIVYVTQSLTENFTSMKRKPNDLMESSDCIPMPQKKCLIINETVSKLSQNSEVTKRKSNDFMEITECMVNSSHHLKNKDVIIQVTQNFEEIITGNSEEPQSDRRDHNATDLKSNDIDLTESPEINDQTEPTNKNTCNEKTDNHLESMDLTQSSNSSDELPYVCLTGTNSKSLDDTLLVDINDYAHINKKSILQTDAEIHIDLTQSEPRENETSVHSQSFFEKHDHSESTESNKYSVGKENTSQSPRKRNNKDNYSCANNNNKHSLLLNASTIKVETIPVEEHPANNLRYPKPGKVDLTIENFDENGFILTKQEPIIKDANDNANLPQDHLEKIDLTQNLDNNDSNHANNVNTPTKSKDAKSNSFSTLQDPVDDIDLTQHSDESGDLSQTCRLSVPDIPQDYNVLSDQSRINSPHKSKQQNQEKSSHTIDHNDLPSLRRSECCSSLGKKDDMSIDYDEFINADTNSKRELMVYENPDESKPKFSRTNSMVSNCSQNSEVFDLTDKELDYSLHQSRLEIPKDNFEFGGISVMDELSNLGTSKKSFDTGHNSMANFEVEDEIESFPNVSSSLNGKKIGNRCKEISPIKHRRLTEIATPQKPSSSNMITVTTPKNSELIIKTNNVTPMIDYKSMATPDLHKELDKYGIKPFKRKRAIQLLTHIYNQTHPIIENADQLASPPKRHKPNNDTQSLPKKFLSPRKLITSPSIYTQIDLDETSNQCVDRQNENKEKSNNFSQKNGITKGKRSQNNQKENHDNIEIGNSQKNKKSLDEERLGNTLSKRDEKAVVIKEIECNPEDWVFQKREKAKVYSCRVPLHIAFYNYVSSRRDLRESILCYEPVEIDVIHKDLVSYGHRYDPKDLLKFLDKKCITVKTTDNDGRNQKR